MNRTFKETKKKQYTFSVSSALFLFYESFRFMVIYFLRNMNSVVSIVIRFQGGPPRVVVQFVPNKRGCSLFQSVQPSVEANDFSILWYRGVLLWQ